MARRAEPAVVPALLDVLRDPHPAVRREAAKSLGVLRDRRAVPALIAALDDADANVRMYAAAALGEIRDPAALDALLRALGDPQWCVRDQAAWAVHALADPQLAGRLAALLQDDAADEETVVWLLRGCGEPVAVAALQPLLASPTAATRVRAVQALGRWTTDAARDLRLAALQDPDPRVRRAALDSLPPTADEPIVQKVEERLAVEPDANVRAGLEQWLQQAVPKSEPAAWWSFDDQHASTARDVTGRGSDGEIRGAVSAPGKVGAALKFDGKGCISLGKVPKLPLANLPLTVMAWVKPEASSGVVVARGGAFCGYSLYIHEGIPKFGIHRVQDGPTDLAAGRQPVGRDWVHLAGVIRNDRIELYVDGKQAAVTPTAGFIPGNCGQGMEIGGDLGNSPAEITTPLTGLIDEVKVFAAALPEKEIAKQCVTE
jgi:hypothetical protein